MSRTPRPLQVTDSVPPLSTGLSESAAPPGSRATGRVLLLGLTFLGAAAVARALHCGPAIESPGPAAQRTFAVGMGEGEMSLPAPVTLQEDRFDVDPPTLADQRRHLLARMERELGLAPDPLRQVATIFAASPVMGQGNPSLTQHPMSRSECRRIRAEAGVVPARVTACGAPNMVPIFDREGGRSAADAPVCIDQFEFPGIPCEYPVVQVRAREAALLCEAVGKRICDAHEWEGACAGSLRPAHVEYEFGRPRPEASWFHNFKRELVWSYGPTKNHALCATGSMKTPECVGGYEHCGSNTYPSGAFPACQSAFGAFDMNGNVAEHMNLPILPSELAGNGGTGFTEMKGSWFIFGATDAHPDDCRYRAPDWHETRLMSEASHWNYHLGFRCCRDIDRP